LHTDSSSFKNVQINLHRKSTMKIAHYNVFNLPTLKGMSKTTYKYGKKLTSLLWEKKIPIWIFNLQIWWDIMGLCSHGITSNLISKGCETREPSAYALIELETEDHFSPTMIGLVKYQCTSCLYCHTFEQALSHHSRQMIIPQCTSKFPNHGILWWVAENALNFLLSRTESFANCNTLLQICRCSANLN
jgi:hypothetical protein